MQLYPITTDCKQSFPRNLPDYSPFYH